MMTTRAIPENLKLSSGSHRSIADGACAMELASWIAGEPWSDHPRCVPTTIASFMRNWNDNLDDADRTRLLLPLVPLCIGADQSDAAENRRACMALDWLSRVHLPAWLDATPSLSAHAAALRALPEITDDTAADARAAVSAVLVALDARAARAAAARAARAARAAASGAAASAVWAGSAATWDDSAWATDAARATDAAWASAARAAALVPEDARPAIVARLQESAQDLVRRMCAATG